MHSDKKEASVWLQARLLCSYQIAMSVFLYLITRALGSSGLSLPREGVGGALVSFLFAGIGAWLCVRYLAKRYLLHRSQASKIVLVSLLILPVFLGLLAGVVLVYTFFLPPESAALVYAPLSVSLALLSSWQWWIGVLLTHGVYFAVMRYLYRRVAQVA